MTESVLIQNLEWKKKWKKTFPNFIVRIIFYVSIDVLSDLTKAAQHTKTSMKNNARADKKH